MSGTGMGARALCHRASRVLVPPRPDWLPLTRSNTSMRCSGPTRGPPSKAPTTGECHCQCIQTALYWLDPHQHRAGDFCLQLPKSPRPPGMCPTSCEVANALSHHCTQALHTGHSSKVLPASVQLQGWRARGQTSATPATTCLPSQGLTLGDSDMCPPCSTGSVFRARGEQSSAFITQFAPVWSSRCVRKTLT